MSTDSEFFSNRVFILVSQEMALARLTSCGSSEMFWESFRVEPLVKGDMLAKLLDPETWSHSDFVLRHERTGVVLDAIFSAGGRPPRSLNRGEPLHVSIRGTYMFTPPARASSFVSMLEAIIRTFVK